MMRTAYALLLACLPLIACGASEDSSTDGDTEDNLTSAEHGDAVLKCIDDVRFTSAKTSALVAAVNAGKACMAKANDATIKQFDARRPVSSKSARVQFATFRATAEAACVAYINARNPSESDRLSLLASCGFNTEHAMADLIQSSGGLGARTIGLGEVRWKEQPECYSQFKNNGPKLRECVESGVAATIKAVSPSSLPLTLRAMREGNVPLCEVFAARPSRSATVAAEDACRAEAAVFLQQLQAEPHAR